jgi:hypothetical protein
MNPKTIKPNEATKIEINFTSPFPRGTKILTLSEFPHKGKKGSMRVETFSAEWSFEELSEYIDRLLDMIWEDQYPDEALLRRYLDFKIPHDTPIPTSIRVPQSLIEIINHERGLRRQQKQKEENEIKEFAKKRGLKD